MKRICVKEEICIGCHLCEVYCLQKHSQSTDLIKAFKNEVRPVSGLRMEVKGHLSFPVRCQQCDDTPCVFSCLTGALHRDPETGVVTADTDKCVGCWTCLLVCPFGAINRDLEKWKTVRCDLCQGKDIPVCVANCPNEALIYSETEVVGEED